MSPLFSFIIDSGPLYTYQGYHLAHSLMTHAAAQPADIHVHFTPRADANAQNVFRDLGCSTHSLQPFGDSRFCNKIAQLDNLLETQSDRIVLLDTDMIAVGDFTPFLAAETLLAKTVDLGNPAIDTLRRIASAAAMAALPAMLLTDAGESPTYLGNCNGGFYSFPRTLLKRIRDQWRRWATWLLENPAHLHDSGKSDHTDQVAMWLAIHMDSIPYQPCPSNLNYFVHMPAHHLYQVDRFPICILHYHKCLEVHGLISPGFPLPRTAADAVNRANHQIARNFNNRIFWDWRYNQHPQRGSGVGSMGKSLELKRRLLSEEQIESAQSVLDVGCGNLEVMKCFNLRNYLGLDQSEQALLAARSARPDWQFRAFDAVRDVVHEADSIDPADMVICFEVLIHQETPENYHRLIEFLAAKTKKKLIVSGYDSLDPAAARNHMIFFHEPLHKSLERTNRFRTIEPIGDHGDVKIYRCEV